MTELNDSSQWGDEKSGEPVQSPEAPNWANSKQLLKDEQVIREIFSTLHRYLQGILEKEQDRLKDPEVQKGIRALMVLASEATQKMDQFSPLVGSNKPSKFEEYKELQHFYLHTVARHFEPNLSEEEWEKRLAEKTPDFLDAREPGIRDLETVRHDREYELFYIKDEEGKPYFNRELLRHLKLVGNFDQFIEATEFEDPFFLIQVLRDKDLYRGATEIVELARPYIDNFYKERTHLKDSAYISAINKALMALMMAAHGDHLLENGSAKGCISYYSDFHRYLRHALTTEEYHALLATTPESHEPFQQVLLNLTHAFCQFFFMRSSSCSEMIELIRKLIERGHTLGKEKSEQHETEHSFWKKFLISDRDLRYLLKHYPSGPLLKTLDSLRGEEGEEGFDPLLQQNFPNLLYAFTLNEKHISVIRLPSPTKQMQIQTSQVTPEFFGMLRSFKAGQPSRKFLLINLQSRTSWEDSARAEVLESLSKEAEYLSTLTVMTLPKQTDFYFQGEEYELVNGASIFIEQLLNQIADEKESGYFFPKALKGEKFFNACKEMIHRIHRQFFEKKEQLTKLERTHFIELFHHLLALKVAQQIGCDCMSFTCKDALDIGAAASASFYGCLHTICKGSKWNSAEYEFLLWLFYYPALFIRERAIDQERLKCAVLTLELFEKGFAKGTQSALHLPEIGLLSKS